jgi:transcriptional regulator GlxA family with amidase domain
VRSHFWGPISAEQLAQSGGCSTSTVERHFRRYAGQRPQEWIRNVRLDHAARLLRSSNLTVGEVARRCGFLDSFYFSRQFRTRYGMPPSLFSRRQSAF